MIASLITSSPAIFILFFREAIMNLFSSYSCSGLQEITHNKVRVGEIQFLTLWLLINVILLNIVYKGILMTTPGHNSVSIQ